MHNIQCTIDNTINLSFFFASLEIFFQSPSRSSPKISPSLIGALEPNSAHQMRLQNSADAFDLLRP